MHKLICTKHEAHSLRIRSNNSNDTLLIRYLYVRNSSRCDHNFVRRMPPCCNRTVTVLRTNIPYELGSVNKRVRIGHSSAYVENFVHAQKIFDILSEQQRMSAYCDELKTNSNRWADELQRIPTYVNECQKAPYGKPLYHWDATSSGWVCELIRKTVVNCRETFAWYRKVLACIANSSRTVRQSYKHVILFGATKIIAKPSPSHRICREPVPNPSPTLCRRSQTHRKKVSAICTMRYMCYINKTISRLNCEK